MFTVVVDSAAKTATFDLNDQLDHGPVLGDDATLDVDLGSWLQASVTDADGDTVSTNLAGLVSVSVENDVPTLTLAEEGVSGAVQEDALGLVDAGQHGGCGPVGGHRGYGGGHGCGGAGSVGSGDECAWRGRAGAGDGLLGGRGHAAGGADVQGFGGELRGGCGDEHADGEFCGRAGGVHRGGGQCGQDGDL